jgi:hypothetical protein
MPARLWLADLQIAFHQVGMTINMASSMIPPKPKEDPPGL